MTDGRFCRIFILLLLTAIFTGCATVSLWVSIIFSVIVNETVYVYGEPKLARISHQMDVSSLDL